MRKLAFPLIMLLLIAGTLLSTFPALAEDPTETPTPTPTETPTPTPTSTPTPTPTPTPTTTPTPSYVGTTDAPVSGFGVIYPNEPGGETEDSWWQWKLKIDSWFDPVIAMLGTSQEDLINANAQACGITVLEYAPGDFSASAALLSAEATLPEMAQVMGAAVGQPIAYTRALMTSGPMQGLSFFNLLIYYALGSMVWMVGIIVITILIRTARTVIQLVVELYKLLPGKAT